MYSIMASVSNESCASSFPIWVPFISVSSVIALTKTFKTMCVCVCIILCVCSYRKNLQEERSVEA